jgi:hypothetical protein
MKLFRGLRRFADNFMASPHDPDFMVIGAQKAGTTSLHKYLQRHPQMCGSRPKEPHYFNRDIYAGVGLDQYRRNFTGRRRGYYFESTPAYLYSPGAAELIHTTFPDIRLIVMLRDPVKRAYSAWNHYRELFDQRRYLAFSGSAGKRPGYLLYEKLYQGREAFPGFRECIDIELDMIEKNEGFEPALLRRGLYLRQLQEYWRYFDRERMLLVGFRDLVETPAHTLAEVTRFIGAQPLSWDRFEYKPENARRYAAPMADEDARLLAEYYRQSNEELFQVVGKVNW